MAQWTLESNPTQPNPSDRESSLKVFIRLSLLAGCLVAAPAIAAPPALPDGADKLEFSLGLTRGTNSLFKGVLLHSRTEALIAANYERGRFFANTQTGVGYKLLNTDTLTVGVSANYLLGRREASESRYRGLGDVSASLAAYGYFEWQPVKDLITVYGNLAQSLRRSSGMQGNVGTTLACPLGPGVYAFLDYALGAADARYMQAYYGVTGAQSAGSGYAVYSPAAGHLSSALSVGVQADLNERWSLLIGVGSTRLGGNAAASPMVKDRSQPSANAFVTYKY